MHSRFLNKISLGISNMGILRGRATKSASRGPKFGIDLLPDGLGFLPCSNTVAFVAQSQAAINIWLPALFKDCLTTSKIFLISDDKSWVDRLLSLSTLQLAFVSKQLKVMLNHSNISDEIKRRGIQSILDELENNGLENDHTVLWVGAHPWLHELNLDEIQSTANVMKQWSAKRNNPTLFVFLNPPDAGDLAKKLGKMFGLFPSVAMLSVDRNWLSLTLERWNGDKGAVFGLNFSLDENADSHRLFFNGCLTHGSMHEIIEAPDKDVVIATQAAIAGQRNIPNNWKILSQAGDGAAAVAGSVAATIVLHAGTISDFGTLTRVVHHLRMTHPRTLKIVIRENEAKLRINNERALMHLGANLIAYREVGFARLIQMIHDIRDQTFNGDLDADYDTALSSYVPDIESGYIAPAEFCKKVLKTLARTESSGMSHTLVQLHILPIIPHLDAMNACRVFRDGDLVTADAQSLFVFLFACTESDVDAALQRLFSVPVTQLFSSQVTDSSMDGMKIIIDRLLEASHKGLPNYSAMIAHPRSNVISVAFKQHHLSSHADDPIRLPMLSANPLLTSSEPAKIVDAPTFQPRVIRSQRHLSNSTEQAA